MFFKFSSPPHILPMAVHEIRGWGWGQDMNSDSARPLKHQQEHWSESAGGGWWGRWRASPWPESLRDNFCGLRDGKMEKLQVICQKAEDSRRNASSHKPAEKGMKASRLTNFSSLSRKWAGLKEYGLSHSLSSFRTEVRRGTTVVPYGQQKHLNTSSYKISSIERMQNPTAVLKVVF